MKLKSLLSLVAMVIAAKASAITYDASVNGTAAPAGVTFSATGGSLVADTKNGVTFLGVTGGQSTTEIDFSQSITINFTSPQFFQYLTIGLLFDGPEYGDLKEIAAASVPTEFRLQAVGPSTATWTQAGNPVAGSSVWNLANTAVLYGQGLWKVINPFPSIGVTKLTLTPVWTAGQGPKPSNSDFGLVAFKTPDVASTFGLAGLSLLAVAYIARRK